MRGRRAVSKYKIDDCRYDEGSDKRTGNDRKDLPVVGTRRLRAHRAARVGGLAVRGSAVPALRGLLGVSALLICTLLVASLMVSSLRVASLLVSSLRVASLMGVSACSLLRLEGLLIMLRKWRTHSELS